MTDDVRPNTYVNSVDREKIVNQAVEAAADTEGVVCQSITDFIAAKFDLGNAPKIAYGYTRSSQYSADINFSDAGFSTTPIVVFVPHLTTYNPQYCTPVPCWISNVTTTTATVYCGNNPWYEGVYWMAIGT
jgi:hypothetical protein